MNFLDVQTSMSSLRDRVCRGEKTICFGGRGSNKILVATDFTPLAADEALRQEFSPTTRRKLGIMGLISYSDGAGDGGAKSRFVCVDSANINHIAVANAFVPKDVPPLRLRALGSDAAYLHAATSVKEDILNGRYYQLNLLRYFAVEPVATDHLWERWRAWSGPFGVWWQEEDFRLVSFSPERFIRVEADEAGCVAETEPIKGTGPTTVNEQDAKERAELNIIVDLMRNDLHRICIPHTVSVIDAGSVRHFPGIAHRVARIRGRLRPGLTLRDFIQAVCPGGSITGAPKREVMNAIRAYEERPRDFFMGNAFYWNGETGEFDSSILIRTLLCPPRGAWEYAAGSGLTLGSDPLREAAEIHLKCGALNSP